MHVQLKFDMEEAEWYGELAMCPTMPPMALIPGHKYAHNVPLSAIVEAFHRMFPQIDVDVDHASLIAYRMYKAMMS